ncbi:MAG TPA: hypothetical protein VNH46_01745, partial [Gemmatimonadales bacterium]|nr:hypothetical protein [Gemmatimonadales bacterium]
TGLHIVLPSGVGQDNLNASGPQSLTAYAALFPGMPWTQFLSAYAGGQATTAMFDQGNNRFEAYLVWESQAVAAGADVDFWVLEPDGNIYLPAFGSVTPNGTMSNDSWNDGVNFEGYLTNRFVQKGPYDIFANLWRDPQDYRPVYDLAYRYDQAGNFSLFYAGQGMQQPMLSLQSSWLDDPSPSITKIKNGDYTDLQYVATQTYAAPPAPALRRGETGTAALRGSDRSLTPAQVTTLRRLVTASRLGAGLRQRGGLGLWDLPFSHRGAR